MYFQYSFECSHSYCLSVDACGIWEIHLQKTSTDTFFELVLGISLFLEIIFKYFCIKMLGAFEHFSPKRFEICFLWHQRGIKNWSTAIRCSRDGKHRHHLFIIKELLLELLPNFILWVVTGEELQYYSAAKEIFALHIPMNIWCQRLFFMPCLSKCIRNYTLFFLPKIFGNNFALLKSLS